MVVSWIGKSSRNLLGINCDCDHHLYSILIGTVTATVIVTVDDCPTSLQTVTRWRLKRQAVRASPPRGSQAKHAPSWANLSDGRMPVCDRILDRGRKHETSWESWVRNRRRM